MAREVEGTAIKTESESLDYLVQIINDLMHYSPTYTESGNYQVCVFCRSPIEVEGHSVDCPWIVLSNFDVKTLRVKV